MLKSQLTIAELSPTQPANAAFRSFVSRSISVLEVCGAPIDLRKAASGTGDVHLLRLQRGSAELSHADGSVKLDAGSFVAYRGGRALQFRHDNSIDLSAIFLPARAIERWLPDWQAAEFVVARQQAEGRLGFEIARDLLDVAHGLHDCTAAEAVGDVVARLIARSLSITALSGAGAPEDLAEAHRRRVKQFCRQQLGAAGLGVESVARATGLSRASLHRLFRDQPHSLMQWVQLERLEACRRLMREASWPQPTLTEIALSMGFKSSAHFSAAFRQRYGVAPRDYRRAQHAKRSAFDS